MGRLRGCLWLTAGLVVAVLAGAVAFITLQRAAVEPGGQGVSGPTVEAVVAGRVIEVRSMLVAEDLEVRELPADAVPEGYLASLEEAVGKITLVDLFPGEVLVAQRLLDPNVITGDGRLALVVTEDEVLMAFPATDLMSRVGVLKPGDHVDILVSLDFPVNRGARLLTGEGGTVERETEGGTGQQEQVTFNLLQNVSVAALVTTQTATGGEGGTPQALLLTVSPQDALLLKYAKDAGGIMDIVLRAPAAEQPFETEPVDVDYMINRYRIPTEVGR